MRLRLLSISRSGLGLFALGIVVGVAAPPLWKGAIIVAAQERYGELTYLCDHAMREHLIAKQQLALHPKAANVSTLKAAEVALIDCQDYDMMRKRLIFWGLTENDLSLMGLKAIEAHAMDLQKVIQIHEIRY